MSLYRRLSPLLGGLEPERAHRFSIRLLASGLLPDLSGRDDPILQGQALGRSFSNPIGLAAGFDKNAEVPNAMLKLGFGFVEIGSVTPRPQSGNPRPRLFRLTEDRAVINRLGFNNEGHAAVEERLLRRPRRGIIGVNLGANKDSADRTEDYVSGVRRLAPYADYLVINVSSPNTPGLRALQGEAELDDLLARVQAARDGLPRKVPLVLKIAPDLVEADLDAIATVSLRAGLDGIIVSNTTIERPESLRSRHRSETGGLSGAPLMAKSTAVLAEMRKRTSGKLCLIGTGGVASGADAFAKIAAGASLVQLYSALVFEGPGLIGRIKRELAARLRSEGFRSLAEAVGSGVR